MKKKKQHASFILAKTAIISSIHPSDHMLNWSVVRILGRGSEWGCYDVLVMAGCIILQNAPQGPLQWRQLLCTLNVIILCLYAPPLIYCEQREAAEMHCK